MTITVNGKAMVANAAFDALLEACPEIAVHLAADPGGVQAGTATFEVACTTAKVTIDADRLDVDFDLGSGIDMTFSFVSSEDEPTFQLMYLGDDGDLADKLCSAGLRGKTLGEVAPSLPAFLAPFANTRIVGFDFEEGRADGPGDYVALNLAEPIAMRLAA